MQLANGIVAPDAIILEEKKYRTPWSKSLRIYFWIVVVMIFFALSASAEERMLGEQIDGFRLSMSENEEGTRFKLLDKDGHQVGDSHSFIGEIQNGFAVIGDGVKYGIMDLQGKITVPLAYDYIQYVTDSVFCAFNEKGIMLVSGLGEVVAFFEAEHAELVYVDGIYINFYCTTGAGLLRVDGKMMIEPIWEEVSTPHCGMIRCSGEECYYYDENGHQIFKCAIGFNFSDNLAHAVSDLGEDIIVDTSGNVLYTSNGEKALVGIFSNGVCQAMDTESGKYGYVGKDGSWIIQPIYDSAMYFRDGYAAVELSDRSGLINTTGEIQIDFVYDWMKMGKDGLVSVGNNGMYGIVNLRNEVISPMIWDGIGCFKNGFCTVKKGDRYGAIDTSGKVTVPCQFTWITDFESDRALVDDDEQRTWVIDSQGNIIAPYIG